MILRATVVVALAGAGSAAAAGMQLMMDRRALEEAIAIGQSTIAVERSRFHEPYRLMVGKAPVDAVHVVTPFRRVVLAAEDRARAGDRSFGQREAIGVLAGAIDEIDFLVELTFHPLNTYVGVPEFDVVLQGSRESAPVEPRTLDRVARFGPRVEGMPLPAPVNPIGVIGTQPLLGATLIARVDARPLDADGTYDLIVREGGRELARAAVDLAKLR